MEIVVTGACGFVGLNVVRRLAASGVDVIAVDRAPPDSWVEAMLEELSPRVRHITVDLAHHNELERVAGGEDVDAVIHAAVITATTVDVEIEAARDIVDSNLGGTVEALDFAVNNNAKRFVYVSSPSAIGDTGSHGPIDESIRTRPTTLYGITKLASELTVRRWAALHPIETVAVRIAQPYGPGERATASRRRTSPIWEWLLAASRGDVLPTGPPDRARDWTYVEDTAKGIATLATHPMIEHEVYHLGVGKLFTVGQTVEVLQRHFGSLQLDAEPPQDVLNPNIRGPMRPPLDVTRFACEFGWQPETSLEQGLERYLGWWRETGAGLMRGT